MLSRDTDLARAVSEKIHSLSERSDYARKMTVSLNFSETNTGILVDRDWFGTVIENLVKNSIEACRQRCRIKVYIESSPEQVQLIYQDNCRGIPPEVLTQIFTPFISTKKHGQGLGMANARKIVEDHSGAISVTNNEGVGAVFTITFNRDS